MGSLSIWHWLIVLVIIMMVFGTKKLRNMGSDLGGAVSGGIGLAAGPHSVMLQKNGVESGTTKIDLKSGETLSLIGFAEKIPATDEYRDPQHPYF